MIAILAMVPNPGRSRSGNQRSKTPTLMTAVDSPIDSGVRNERPCAKTDHGEFPIVDSIRRASPIPKIANPKNKGGRFLKVIFQRFFAIHVV
tara:strand:- start:2305 stop:2580 length:276 start_codon:yes stop_codon:yes gene_type:complete